MPMECKAIIFDLDGTLLDTLGDISDAANRVMASRRYPVHARDAYKWFIGNGSKRLIERALPPHRRLPSIITDCLQDFITDYSDHWSVSTRPYPGIPRVIAALTAGRIQMAVVTNKPHQFACDMMDHYFDTAVFHPILGQREGIPPKPHPQQALSAAKAMGVAPGSCIFLGDSAVDMETAVRAGMQPVGAGWGFRPVQELVKSGAAQILKHPRELLPMISASMEKHP